MIASTVLSAQQALFTSGIDLVHLGVTVLGRDGKLVTELTADDFELYEDGALQEISHFSRGLESDADTMPMHLGVLLDASGSMAEQDGIFAKTAAIKFLNTLTYAVDMDAGRLRYRGPGRTLQPGRLPTPRRADPRPPAAWVDRALPTRSACTSTGRSTRTAGRCSCCTPDGSDTRSRMRFNETMDLIRASDVTVYAIGFLKYIPSNQRQLERMRLQQLAEMTGGRCYFPTDVDELRRDLRADYRGSSRRVIRSAMSRENPRTDGAWRKIKIALKDSRRDLGRVTVRTRQGYFAPYFETDNAVR